MPRINFLGAGALLIIAVTVAVSIAENQENIENKEIIEKKEGLEKNEGIENKESNDEKLWPDISCQPKTLRKPGRIRTMIWKFSLNEKNNKGVCPKLRFLRKYSALFRMYDYAPNPLMFQANRFVSPLWEELDERHRDVVIKEVEGCRKKFPDMNQLNITSSCGPWKEVLDCFDTAYCAVPQNVTTSPQ